MACLLVCFEVAGTCGLLDDADQVDDGFCTGEGCFQLARARVVDHLNFGSMWKVEARERVAGALRADERAYGRMSCSGQLREQSLAELPIRARDDDRGGQCFREIDAHHEKDDNAFEAARRWF